MAENRTINIKINQNADEATQDFKKYNKEVGNTKKAYDAVLKSGKPYEQQLADINKIVKETPLNVRDMNKQIQAYQSIALSAGRETPVGKEALEKAAQLRDRYIDIQNETKRLADDQRNLEGAMQGVATGVAVYGGIQSAMALSGVESEKLRETMVKLQAAQTLLNSVNQVATALEKESALMLTLKAARTKALAAAQTIYTAVTGKATKATKLFKIGLASTGIGLLVVGIGLLIENFDKLLGLFKPVIDGFKAIGDAVGLTNFKEEERAEAQKKRVAEQDKQLKQQITNLQKERDEIQKTLDLENRRRDATIQRLKLQQDVATSEEEQRKLGEQIRQENLQGIQDELNAFEKTERKNIKIREKAIQRISQQSSVRRLTKKELAYLDALKKENAKRNRELVEQDNVFYQEINNKRVEVENQRVVEERARRKEANQRWKAWTKERLAAERQIQDLELSLMDEGIDKELEKERVRFERLKKDVKGTAEERRKLRELYTEQEEQAVEKIREKYRKKDEAREKARLKNIEDQNNAFLDKIAEIEEMNYQRTLSDEERELRAVQDKYFALEEAAKDNADALAEIQIARLNEENDIVMKYQNEADEAQDARDAEAKAKAQALADYRIQIAQTSLSAISDLAELFSKGSEKQAKRAFNVQKAVGIAQATINTAQAITKVLAETTDPTPTQSLRIANAVAIGVAGAVQIASIAAQQFQGGGGDGVQTPSETGTGAVSPEFNVVGDAATNQLAQIQQQPVQAYVVSGEVTSGQALDRNRIENATL